MKRHILVSEKNAAIAAIAKALDFPDWFGQNLDALYDSLSDLSWLPEGEYVLVVPANLDSSVSEVLRDAAKRTAESGDRKLRVIRTDR
ncbi:barstar family protein [Lentzea sp. BCCO 10_0856]|uniref:Barstar family protein n=1 Tax=Lentzea miocenica TaxID=3095431 RepID=A0ABU4TAL2_9PSEU|nr:barstar family protein [Lentzea sp. BCCO 10_0856]MDX8035094.1 barstar family protein [Lentzea sp. BCCO 10_0856]